MEYTSLNISISDDGIEITNSIDNSLELHNGNWLTLIIKYDINFILKRFNCSYHLHGMKKVEDFTFDDIDIATEIGIGPVEIEDLYKSVVEEYPKLLTDIQSFPGGNHIMKFTNYFISGISIVLCFFQLLKSKGEPLFHPIELIFPDIDVNINLLNKKYYNYFNYYIRTLDDLSFKEMVNRNIIKQLLEYISDYFNIFSSIFNKNNEDTIQDMQCIHASTLGYGLYLEKRIQSFTRMISETEDIKRKELNKYYDEEILTIAEKLETIKREVTSNKELLNSYTKRTKEEIDIHLSNGKTKVLDEIKKSSQEIHGRIDKELTDRFIGLNKKLLTDFEKIVNSITITSVNKIKTEMLDILDQKTGVLSEINKMKITSLSEIDESVNYQLKQISELTKGGTVGINELFESSITSIRSNIDNIGKNTELEIIKKIKQQATEIVESILEQILQDFGATIEQQINKRVEKKFEEMKRKMGMESK